MRRLLLAGALVFALGSGAPAQEGDEALERYLEARALTVLLMDHLEATLDTEANPERRIEIAERLAELYATRLDGADDPGTRADLERRSRDLLASVPEAESIQLRLNLHRISYTRAERLAERWRLRLSEAGDAEEAQRLFLQLYDDFERLAAQADQRVRALEKQEESNREYDIALLQDSLSAARAQRSMARYLAGWSGVYLCELTGTGRYAAGAERSFGWLLGAEPDREPQLDRLPTGLLRLEHVARAALGVAVCRALRSAPDEAVAWIDAVASAEELAEGLEPQIFARRLQVSSLSGDWERAEAVVDTRRRPGARPSERSRTPPTPLEPMEARYLAVLTLEAPGDSATLRRLREVAFGDLVARAQLAQVVDLTSRYGAAALGDSGFIPVYARAVTSWRRATDALSERGLADDQPASDAEVAAMFADTASLLRRAIGSGDASLYSEARADATLRLASALVLSASQPDGVARLDEAVERYAWVAEHAPGESRRAEAIWRAIGALETAIEDARARSGSEQRTRRRDELTQRFLDTFPSDDRAGALLIRRIAAGELSDEQAVERLLAIPEESAVAPAAQREALRTLYRLYRDSASAERERHARRFAALARALIEDERRAAIENQDDEALARAVLLSRQALDAALSIEPPDLETARRAMDAVLAMRAAGRLAESEHRAELLFRRFQIALASGELSLAQQISGELREIPGGARFGASATRLLYAERASQWRSGERTADLARALVTLGARLDADAGSGSEGLSDAMRATVLTYIAEGGEALWRWDGDAAARDAALGALRRALELRPDSESLLRQLAELSAEAGDIDSALVAWRRLLAGAEVGSDAWRERKLRVIELVSRRSPSEALRLLEQHRSIEPDYGPAPWGPKLSALHDRLIGAGEGDDS